MPYGTTSDVKAEARSAIEIAGAEGGLIIAPSCTIRNSTLEKNFATAVNTAHSVG
jgi:hypothetical protein